MPTRDVIYKVTMSDGKTRIGPPRRLSALLATYNHPDRDHDTGNTHRYRIVKVEVVTVTEWKDVTEGFGIRKA